jgi:hypothetical protein
MKSNTSGKAGGWDLWIVQLEFSGTVRVLSKHHYVLIEHAAMVTQVPVSPTDLRVGQGPFDLIHLPPADARLAHFFHMAWSLNILM